MNIELLPLPAAALSALRRKRILELRDLTQFTKREIADLNGIGRKALASIIAELGRHGMAFKS